jgi:hypothetical protein
MDELQAQLGIYMLAKRKKRKQNLYNQRFDLESICRKGNSTMTGTFKCSFNTSIVSIGCLNYSSFELDYQNPKTTSLSNPKQSIQAK